MFKIQWDKETGGVKLSSLATAETLGVSPRPVFYEELNLLGLKDLGWKYPECQEPLLWACNKQYFYKGDFVFEAKGANIYDNATIHFQPGFEKLTLKPVDVKKMLERTKEPMFLCESEAIEFIRDVYETYSRAAKMPDADMDFMAMAEKQAKLQKKQMAVVKEDCDSFEIMPLDKAEESGKKILHATKIDVFLASFSGGKDSQVVLDLCTRALPPSAFQVIYSDTGYELPSSLELYQQVQDYYHALYPELKFSLAKNHESVLNYWDKIGTPSDTHRWCCSVMKTAPLYRMLKEPETNKQAKVLTFDGVRAEESTRRSGYARIGKGVKHATVINASPILNWNSVEIFLYLWKYQLPLNISYRKGMTRVGCLVCPFSSEWNDMVVHNCYKENLYPFLLRVEQNTEKAGITDKVDYIKSGNWKRRAGGRDMKTTSYMEVLKSKPDLVIKIVNPTKPLTTWLLPIGEFEFSPSTGLGEIKYKTKERTDIKHFSIKKRDNSYEIVFPNTYAEPLFQGLVKRAFYKAAYCINCEVCEVECPTGALQILPDVHIERKKCIHCHKCLDFHEHGCIVADSLIVYGNNKSNNMKLISYNNFGLNGGWLDFYMTCVDTYFEDDLHGLHPKEQLPNFVKWLVHAGILDDSRTKNITTLGRKLSEIYLDAPEVVWQIIWINLCYNSPIAKWYKESISWNQSFTEEEVREWVANDYPNDSKTTIRNIVYALFRTFRESPIGDMGMLVKDESSDKQKPRYIKNPCEDVTVEAVAYSLFKYAETKGIRSFRISDLFGNDELFGIVKEFGITKNELEKCVRTLNSASNRVVIAELNMGLDHLTLREDISSETVLNYVF